MTTRKDLIEFVLIMGRETSLSPHFVGLLMKLAKQYQRLQEIACERALTKKESEKESRLEKKIEATANTFRHIHPAVGVKFSGDPRGYCVKLVVPSGFTNDMGQEGVYVPC